MCISPDRGVSCEHVPTVGKRCERTTRQEGRLVRRFTTVAAWHERLRAKRRAEGLTQPALGKRLGVNQNRVSDMEKGTWPLRSPELQQAVADYLDEDIVELRREVDNQMPGAEVLDDLRSQVGEIMGAQTTIIDALTETNDHLAKLTSAIEKLNRKRA